MNLEKASAKFPGMWPRQHFNFVDEKVYTGDEATKVQINYTNSIRNGYSYDEDMKKYLKSLNDKAQIDVYNDEQIAVSNIIVQHADHSMVEKAQYVLVNFYYSGDAEYFIGGKHIKGRWVKDFKDDTTHWFDLSNNPIEFLAGNTWIHIVHPKVKISYE